MTTPSRVTAALVSLLSCLLISSDAFGEDSKWKATWRLDLHANYRDSNEATFQLKFPFGPDNLPVGQEFAFMETVDAGSHFEVSLVSLVLDLEHGDAFGARVKVDGIDLYERNPTSTDRKVDLDEAWIRFGEKPDRLRLPSGTSFFLLAGKAPKMERQPVRLLESYGLASTAFNRLEDVQLQIGGSVGRNLYWRGQYSSGNPVFFRDTNALAGDNGIPELLGKNPDPELKSGFPILYDAEVEDYFFDDANPEVGAALGWIQEAADKRWAFDVMAFWYERDLAETVVLEGTFYGGDLDLFDAAGFGVPLEGNRKVESGARLYAEWSKLSLFAIYVDQTIAGLDRQGWEVEAGWEFSLRSSNFPWIRPAVRYSELSNDFSGPDEFPAPSIWWDWAKYDFGARMGLRDWADLTVEYSTHDVRIDKDLNLDELLVTLRIHLD